MDGKWQQLKEWMDESSNIVFFGGAGYRPVAIKHDAGRSYGKSLEAWQVDGDPKPFISQLVQCVDQEERAVAEIVGRLRENPFSENAIDGISLEDGPARGRSL